MFLCQRLFPATRHQTDIQLYQQVTHHHHNEGSLEVYNLQLNQCRLSNNDQHYFCHLEKKVTNIMLDTLHVCVCVCV